MTDSAGLQLGKYNLLRMLGEGGFADVYLGEHVHLKSLAAIKVLNTRLTSELQENFLNEARILAQLIHPHIVRILDFGVEEGVPYLVMDYAPHGTLRHIHPYNTRIPLPTVVEYVKQITDGLQYAHDKKLIHRDLKPDNVLLGQRDELLISDFGVALLAESTRRSSRNAEEGFAGTASYMAPEQLRGQPQFASDQYALGIMTYEWLCGTRPFQGTVIELYSQHHSVPPAPLRKHTPQLPAEVEQVVLRALEKDPANRFPDVTTFAMELEQASHAAQSTGNLQFIALPVITPPNTGRSTTDGPTKLLSFSQSGLATLRAGTSDAERTRTSSAPITDATTMRVAPFSASQPAMLRSTSADAECTSSSSMPAPDSSIADNPTNRLPALSEPQSATPPAMVEAEHALSPSTPVPDIPTTPLPDLPTNHLPGLAQAELAVPPSTPSQPGFALPSAALPDNSYATIPALQTDFATPPALQTNFASSTPPAMQANFAAFVEPETPLPIQPYPEAMMSPMNPPSEPATEASQPRKRSSVGKIVLLAGLAMLLIVGAVLAALIYSTNQGNQRSAKDATSTPSAITITDNTTATSVQATDGPSTPVPTGTSSSVDTNNATPTANVTAPVSNPVPTVVATPTKQATVASTPTSQSSPTLTPTTTLTPTPVACASTSWQMSVKTSTVGSTSFTTTSGCNQKVLFSINQTPSFPTDIRACTASGSCSAWVSATTGNRNTLFSNIAVGTSFHLEARATNATQEYTISGELYY